MFVAPLLGFLAAHDFASAFQRAPTRARVSSSSGPRVAIQLNSTTNGARGARRRRRHRRGCRRSRHHHVHHRSRRHHRVRALLRTRFVDRSVRPPSCDSCSSVSPSRAFIGRHLDKAETARAAVAMSRITVTDSDGTDLLEQFLKVLLRRAVGKVSHVHFRPIVFLLCLEGCRTTTQGLKHRRPPLGGLPLQHFRVYRNHRRLSGCTDLIKGLPS